MKRFSPLLVLVLAGCSNADLPKALPQPEHVYQVSEFLADRSLLTRVSAVCGNDPGRTLVDPNCINARRAVHLASIGTIPQFKP